jgi:hypothetical protein
VIAKNVAVSPRQARVLTQGASVVMGRSSLCVETHKKKTTAQKTVSQLGPLVEAALPRMDYLGISCEGLSMRAASA